MNRILLLIVAILGSVVLRAQLLTWTPPFPEEANTSQSLVITVDATKGNKGLMNYANTGDVYVHIGIITSKSSGSTDWKYSKFTWGTTNAAAKATYVSANKWQYTISGSLRSFFGITDATETIQKIAILFRSGNGNIKQTNSDGSHMYIWVYNNATLTTPIEQPYKEPRYNPVPETQTWTVGSTFTVQGVANQASDLKLYHNNTVIGTAANATSITATATVASQGQQQLVVEATAGGVTKWDTVNIFVAPTASPVVALPAGLRDGINYDANGTAATLVLYAPGKEIVTVIGDFNNWTEGTQYIMNKTPDGARFWLRLTGLTAGTEYGFQYVVDNSIRIADPYVQKVLDPWNDQYIPATTYPNLKPYPTGKTTGIVGVLQTGATPYNWSIANFNRPDKRSLVIYELLVRDFIEAHDWKTLQDTLSYFKRLGINAIEIMPFNEFEGNLSWGYNPDYYFAPDKYYGTANSLKAFIDACHAAGIAVIMDIALNHQFGLSPLVQLYWDAANSRPAANNPWFNPVATHPFNVGFDM
ncbi:MAG: alpha-amylase family glycosyl hydrolase, partial [Chitinophagaceae bacterium]